MAKYHLTPITSSVGGIYLHRIRYEDGTLGGWIQHEGNLSQEGACKILNESEVWGQACVSGDAFVRGSSRISGFSKISGSAIVEDAVVRDHAEVAGFAIVSAATLCEFAQVVWSLNSAVTCSICGKSTCEHSKESPK